MADSTNPIMAVAYLAIAFIVYFLPSFIASNRKHHNSAPIFLLNLVLGWSVIGWVAALLWSISAVRVSEKPIQSTELDKYGELERLSLLKEKGHITDKEFEAEKAKLLKS